MHTQGPFIMLWVFLKIILLIYLLLTVLGFFVAARFVCFSLGAVSVGYSSLQRFSLQWLLLLQGTGSRHSGFSSCGTEVSSCNSWVLEHRLSSCGTQV